MKVADGSYEDVPLGVYTISDAQWGTSGIAITAYDNMSLLDRTFSAERLTGTPHEILTLACSNCKMTLGMSAADFETIPNGKVKVTMSADNDISTWRDVVSWIAQTCAANAFADRDGRLVLRTYNTDVVDTIDDSHRLSGCTFGDYETKYTGLSVVNQAAEKTNYYGADEDDGLTYDLGSNPFLQDDQIRDGCCENILSALSAIQYVPFKVSMIGDPAFDLMDVLCFSGGAADGTKLSCITKFTYTYNSRFEIEGVGKNPALATRNDKSDKDLSGLISQVESVTKSINKLLYDYNTGPMEFGVYEQIIGNITFYVSQQVDVEGHFLMSYTASEASHLILRFYDTTVEELFSPCEFDIIEGGGGTIGIPHAYLERLQGVHSLVVTAQCTSGRVVIDTRALFFSINAGNYVEALDDLTMDVRDISVRQLQEQNGPDQIWAIGIEDGELLVAHRDYDEKATKRPEWASVADLGKAVDAAIEFNGYWTRRSTEEVFTLVTKDQPWYFWVTEDGMLHGQEGEDETTRLELDSGVSSVHACRGFKSEVKLSQDQGLVVVYIKSGHVWYRQYKYFSDVGVTKWDKAYEVDSSISDADHCSVARLNDYRMAVTIHSTSNGTKIYITDRTYVMQAVPREKIDLPETAIPESCLYPPGTDLSVNVLEKTQSEDGLTYSVKYNRLFQKRNGEKMSPSDFSFVCTPKPDGSYSVRTWEFAEDKENRTSTLRIQLSEAPVPSALKYEYDVTLNPEDDPTFLAQIGDYGVVRVGVLKTAFIFDRTRYNDYGSKEAVALPQNTANEPAYYTHKGELTGKSKENLILPVSVKDATELFFSRKNPEKTAGDERITLPKAPVSYAAVGYYDKNEQPI